MNYSPSAAILNKGKALKQEHFQRAMLKKAKKEVKN